EVAILVRDAGGRAGQVHRMELALELPREALVDLDHSWASLAELRREPRLPEVGGLEEVVIDRDDVRLCHRGPPGPPAFRGPTAPSGGAPARAASIRVSPDEGKLMRFQDKVVFITGGAIGFGRAFARAFVAEGAGVVIAEIDDDQAEQTARELRDAGGRALA